MINHTRSHKLQCALGIGLIMGTINSKYCDLDQNRNVYFVRVIEAKHAWFMSRSEFESVSSPQSSDSFNLCSTGSTESVAFSNLPSTGCLSLGGHTLNSSPRSPSPLPTQLSAMQLALPKILAKYFKKIALYNGLVQDNNIFPIFRWV